jgi:hypothetical protein
MFSLGRFHNGPLSVAPPRSCYTSRLQHHAPARCSDLAQPEPAAAAIPQDLPGPREGRLPSAVALMASNSVGGPGVGGIAASAHVLNIRPPNLLQRLRCSCRVAAGL